MTKSAITRERLEWLSQISCRDDIEDIGGDEIRELASMALAAMDSEPVAWINGCNKSVPAALRYLAENPRPIGGESSFNTAHLYQLAREIELMAEAPLYRHAQPAPEREQLAIENFRSAIEGIGHIRRTLEETFGGLHGTHVEPDVLAECKAICDAIYAAYGRAQQPVVPEEAYSDDCPELYPSQPDSWAAGWNACRAAMLQAQSGDDGEPTEDERIMAIEGIHNCERCGDEGWIIGEMGITSCACGQAGTLINEGTMQAGNYSVIPEWIPVSERMPEDEQEVLTINRMGHRFVSFFDKHSGLFFDRLDAPAACCIEHVLVTHWMPLPAVPQEVNRE